jgi:hypothetical protein
MHNRLAVVLGTYSMIGCSMTVGETLVQLVVRLPVSSPVSSTGNQTARTDLLDLRKDLRVAADAASIINIYPTALRISEATGYGHENSLARSVCQERELDRRSFEGIGRLSGAVDFGCGTGRRTSEGGLSSRSPW